MITVSVDCDGKKIKINWSVQLVLPTALHSGLPEDEVIKDAYVSQIEAIFNGSFNRNGNHFTFGDCKVIFTIDIEVSESEDPKKGRRGEVKDQFVIKDPKPGGGGNWSNDPNCNGWVLVHPDSTEGDRLDREKTRNEMGHAFGLIDPPGREWDDQGVTPDHITEIVKRCAWPAALCCRAIRHAITDRLIEDEEDIEWLEKYNQASGAGTGH